MHAEIFNAKITDGEKRWKPLLLGGLKRAVTLTDRGL
jgi:hypothetical protein